MSCTKPQSIPFAVGDTIRANSAASARSGWRGIVTKVDRDSGAVHYDGINAQEGDPARGLISEFGYSLYRVVPPRKSPRKPATKRRCTTRATR